MSNLQRKLRSRTGASMLLALVFLLFCSFIGGSVLVSATANAYRVAQVAEQQDFLNQRSAALLLSDQLQLETGEMFRLLVLKEEKTYQQYDFTDEKVAKPIGDPVEETVIIFQLTTNDNEVTALQRLMLETTVWRYLLEDVAKQDGAHEYKVVIQNFWKEGNAATEIGIGDFWYQYVPPTDDKVTLSKTEADKIQGEIAVSGSWLTDTGTVNLPGYTATFENCKGDDLYDFVVSFGEDSQLQLVMGAYSGTSKPFELDGTIEEGTMPGSTQTVNVKVTTKTTTTSISWGDPVVKKGDAQA